MAISETRVHFRPGAQPTGRPTADVLAKRLVTASGPRKALDGENIPIKPAAAGKYALGVPAASTTVASGRTVALYAGSGYHVRLECGAAITVTDEPVAVMVGTAGRVIPHTSTNVIVGYAFSSTTAADQEVEVRLV